MLPGKGKGGRRKETLMKEGRGGKKEKVGEEVRIGITREGGKGSEEVWGRAVCKG